MKRICALSIFVLLVTVAAFGSWTERLAVEVPFDFYVGDRAMPAGTYVVDSTTANGSVLTFEHKTRAKQVVVPTTPAERSTSGKSELVFNRLGDTYFLAKIWNQTSNTGRQLSVSGTEREMSKRMKVEPKQLALVIQR